ncbi:MAG: hydrogenase assembly chaperone HypC/HupF [Deltaproteobacteria bacterium]|nr:hydrogenase assembly chaperone HypC/HupF [Deltaproteobacteria bacterium]
MCLAVPAKILSINGDIAVIELGGTQREASLMLLENPSVGDWVILHAGFAIEKLSEEDAQQTFALLREIMDSNEVH